MLQRSKIYSALLLFRGILRHSHRFAMISMLAAGPLFATTSTTTTLAVSTSTTTAQHVITLTATVKANGNAVNPGQVVFCNATAPHCEDLAILGTAQLTTNGTATVKLLLSSGVHKIYAKFLGTRGTTAYAPSNSLAAPQTVNVTGGQNPVDAQILTSGTAANRTLSATVDFGAAPGTGTVLFEDANSHRQIASALLAPSTSRFGLAPSREYLTGDNFLYGFFAPIIGDFNNDGIPDVLQTILIDPPHQNSDGYPTAISLLPGDPSHPGHLLAEINSASLGEDPQGFVVADFNGDGILDLALTDTGAGAVIVSLGDPAFPGKFLPPLTYPSGHQFYDFGICQGDFNGDGLPDLAVVNDGDFSTVGAFSILLNDPAHPGQFLAPTVYTAGLPSTPGVPVAADFNGDGTIDLAFAGNSSADLGSRGEVVIFPGDPSNPGKFLAPVSSDLGPYAPAVLKVGDFNGDGVPDLVFAAGGVGIALGDKAHPGKFLAPQFYSVTTGNIVGLSAGDFNADGVLDVSVSTFDYSYPGASEVLQFFGDPAHPGKLLAGPTYSFGPEVGALAAGDLNGDGIFDVAYGGGDNNGAYIQVQLGQRTETATASHVNSGTTSYASAYYAGDTSYGSVSSCEIPLDMQAATPTIINPTVSNVTGTSATVSWTSNVPTYGQVQYVSFYGPTSTQPSLVTQSTRWDSTESTTHSFVLSNLEPGMEYEYTIYSQAYFSGCNHYSASQLGFLTTANQ